MIFTYQVYLQVVNNLLGVILIVDIQSVVIPFNQRHQGATKIKTMNNNISVGTVYVKDLFNSNETITLPDFQRPYVWTTEKMEQLLTDLKDHFFNDSSKSISESPDYYLGTILLFANKNGNYEIIDGQQRISTLLLIDKAWNTDNSYLNHNKWNLEYNSLISASALKNNYQYLRNNSTRLQQEDVSEIFKKLVFTVVITHSEDEAFTFFDSQNNRGVPLGAVDFLKSYHLRELKGNEALQAIFSKQWDKNNTNQFLSTLFNLILWRSRVWRGKNLYYEYKDAILNEFQKKTIKEQENDTIRLYPNVFNTLSQHLTFSAENGICVIPKTLNLQTKQDDYPFAIRQPIQKGIGFFLFTEKYYAIYELLFQSKKYPEFEKVYNELFKNNSYYLNTFFKLASIMYYDKFKDYKLVHFAVWLDYLLGSYRLTQHYIVAQTVIKLLRDKEQNLLDVIEMAYRPDDIFLFIQKITDNESYNKTQEEKDIGKKYSVRYNYFKANVEFYKNEFDEKKHYCLINKKTWINEYLAKF